MITEEKIKQLRKKLRNGEPQGEIVDRLKADGYSEEDIRKVFAPHRYDMRSWYLTFAFIFLVVGFYLVATDGYALTGAFNEPTLLLFFSGLMFFAYYREVQRLKDQETKNEQEGRSQDRG